MTAALLEVAGLRVDIPLHEGMLHPVRDLSLSVERGETVGIVGESGSGKSLSALAIMGLLPRQARLHAGRLHFKGESLLDMKAARLRQLRGDRIAMIVQDPMTALNPSFTIGNQLIETLQAHRELTTAAARDRAVELLAKVGIPSPESRLGQHPHQLSGGLRQRVMIAMALLCDPDLLIADEPTTALDVTVQAQILDLLASLQRESGMGMVFITHDLGVVSQIADHVVVMYGGQVVETGRVADVFATPLHPYTEGLLQAVPDPGNGIRGGRLGTISGIVPRQFGELDRCVFAGRCPYLSDECLRGPTAMRQVGEKRIYRCVLPETRDRATAEAWIETPETLGA